MIPNQVFLIVLTALLALLWLATLGLTIPPRSFRKHREPSKPGEPMPFRPDLPAAVLRHFADTIGNPVPLTHSAVVWGRARMHIHGLWLPLRFKAWYRPGEAYYRTMQITWFRIPFLRGKDFYMQGHGAFSLAGSLENGRMVDQSQYLALWAAAVWMPSIFVHDPTIRWESIDEHSARLILPFKGGDVDLTAHFDPLSGCMTDLSAMRLRGHKRSDAEPEEEFWRVDLLEWKNYEGLKLPSRVALAWGEAGSPWAYWSLDGLAYNVDVSERLPEKSH